LSPAIRPGAADRGAHHPTSLAGGRRAPPDGSHHGGPPGPAAGRRGTTMAYILNTPDDVRAMLATIGLDSLDGLFDMIPPEFRRDRPLAIPGALSELELTEHVAALAAKGPRRRRPALLPGRRLLRPLHPRGGRRPGRPGGVLHGLHPLPARGQPGDAPGDLRISDPRGATDRHGRLQREPLRRRLGRRRGDADGPDRHPQARPGRRLRLGPPGVPPDPGDVPGQPRAGAGDRPGPVRAGRPRRAGRGRHRRHGGRRAAVSQRLRAARADRGAGRGRPPQGGPGRRQRRPHQPGAVTPPRFLRRRHRGGRGAGPGQSRCPTAARTSACWPAARRSCGRCPAGSSARPSTGTAGAAGS
jgi:hypothetical protein